MEVIFEVGFVDMDSVISDFVKSALQLYGYTEMSNNIRERYPRGQQVEEFLGLHDTEENKAKFWARILDSKDSFWFNLEPLPWYKEVVSAAAMVCREVKILTSPGRSQAACIYYGKRNWLERYGLGDYEFIPVKSKYLLARSDRLLIDDDVGQVAAFQRHDGWAVLFPSITNSLHSYIDSPMFYVGQQLGLLSTRKSELARVQ
jgi:hypothetical protein